MKQFLDQFESNIWSFYVYSLLDNHSPSCLVSTWNLAGCNCAEKSNTFLKYHKVRGLEEPIGGQLTALFPPLPWNNREKKKRPSRGIKSLWDLKWVIQTDRGSGEVNSWYKLASGSSWIIWVKPIPNKKQCWSTNWMCNPYSKYIVEIQLSNHLV